MNKNIEAIHERMRDPNFSSLVNHLGIELTKIEEGYISATMPVDHRTVQPYGLLHGGASVALAESLASIGAGVLVDLSKEMVVGLEINANHLRAVPKGATVIGEGRAVHVGRRTQVWQMEIKTTDGKLVCTSRCTLAVVERKN